MTNTLDDLTQQLLDAAQKAGADGADALAVDGTSVSIDVLHGKLEHAERSEDIDIGLRVLVGQRQACVSASDISTQTIQTMAERAVAMAKEAPEDPNIAQATAEMLASDWDLAALDLQDPTAEPDPADLERDAAEAEAAALAVEGVTQVSSSSAGYGRHQFHLATSNGFSGGYGRTHRAISTVAITGEGATMERDYAGEMRSFQADLPSAVEVGTKAGRRTVQRAGARKPPTGAFPVLYDERISSSLIGHLLSAVNGAMIARGSSWLRDALGEQVLPDGIDLIEDPHRPRISGSRPFDGEGLATRVRKIIDNGTLTGWTLDIATANKLGLNSTASASRGTSSPPSPSISNVTLTQGKSTKMDLTAQMGTGLLVTSMIGSTINPTTGDYSRGASGFWVENGQIAYPVNECTIAGNLRDMLRRIIPANDAEAHLSRMVPSLLVEGMTIAGD
ncbi:metallopeptidase TldD-related protein [Aliiroseovarius sp. F47248L]|uniref:TldD/PmbA family protein n=1 Tax=Aliiroseovarius sp. F47248L TaxID=2926420 RepID=UPI001FF21FAD|nr:metallopeptidase TldD-related protein [Aliiroseovarius sp. F47248L]MCK0140251.1 metallopeptidase TldD-related protein [Aliiroseovarius sp. F47248L]